MKYKRISTIGYCRATKTYCVTATREIDYRLIFFKGKEMSEEEIEQYIKNYANSTE
jgi:2,4-dienoyl-CoA reductase-like NADH-dependent reductase (Old Yellow Enzyme family)